ncbi:hypothetical protein FRC08_009350 [Ceratobasidium sp. 394]|nr:hypothetical protein FRC08_009350 [Ceratobasidium sp. 394]
MLLTIIEHGVTEEVTGRHYRALPLFLPLSPVAILNPTEVGGSPWIYRSLPLLDSTSYWTLPLLGLQLAGANLLL